MSRSGPSKTYEERAANGRVPLNMWLSQEEARILDGLVASGFGATKRDVVGRLLRDAAIAIALVRVAEADSAAQAPRRGRIEATPPHGSPAELAARVRAKGARRTAEPVSIGKDKRRRQ